MPISTDPTDPNFGLEIDPTSPNFGLPAPSPAPSPEAGVAIDIPAAPTPTGQPTWILPKSGMQMEGLQAREFLETPESKLAGEIRGLGDEPVVSIPRIPQQESFPDRPSADIPLDTIIPRSGMQEEGLEARQFAQDLPQTGAAAANVGAGLTEAALTPQNLAIAPVAPSLPGKIALTGAMGKSAYEGVKQSFDPSLTMQQRSEAGLGGIAAAVFAALTAKSMMGGVTKPVPSSVPNLTEAGVLPETLHFAGIRGYAPKFIDDLVAKTFPDLYKDPVKMNVVTGVIRDDNILGGYDDAVQHLIDLRARNAPAHEIQTQLDAVRDIQTAHNLPQLDANVQGAKGSWMQPYIENWEKHVSPEMDRLYNEWKGYNPTTPQETRGRYFKSRMNLLPDFMEQQMRDWYDHTKESPQGQVTNYRNPDTRRDKFMRKALLTGQYSSDTELVLTNSFAARLRNVALMKFYQGLVDKGVAEWLDVGDPVPDLVGGKKAVRWEAKIPITDPNSGLTTMGIRNLAVQEHLIPEMKQLVGTDTPFKQNKLSKYVTGLQLYQLADAVAHGKNMHSVLVHSLKGTGFGDDLIKRLPFLATANAMEDVGRVMLQVMQDSPEIRAEKTFLAKYNMLRPEYGGQHSKFSPIAKTSDLIHKADTASRILLNRWFDALVKQGVAVDTIENRYQFVSRLGEYNRKLMTKNHAALRDIGASPFIVAGKNFNRFSRRLLTGAPGFEATSKGAEIAARAKIMSGTIMAGLIPAVINETTTGHPGGRNGTPIGSIDFGPNYDTPDGKRRNLDVFQLMGIRRGLRGTGVNAVVEGIRTGETPSEIGGHAIEDIVSTALHPYTGPIVGAAERTVFGKRFDLRAGKGEPYGPRDIPGTGRFAEQARVALKEANPAAYSALQPAVNKSMQTIFGVPPSSEDVATNTRGGLAQQVWSKISPSTVPPDSVTRVLDALVKSPAQALGYKETVSPALKMARERSTHYQFDPQQDVRFATRKRIMDAARTNPGQAAAMTAMAQAQGKLTDADVKAMERKEAMPNPLQRVIQGLKVQDAMDVFRMATFGEKKAIYEQVKNKIEKATTLSEPIRRAQLIKLQQLAGPLIQ